MVSFYLLVVVAVLFLAGLSVPSWAVWFAVGLWCVEACLAVRLRRDRGF